LRVEDNTPSARHNLTALFGSLGPGDVDRNGDVLDREGRIRAELEAATFAGDVDPLDHAAGVLRMIAAGRELRVTGSPRPDFHRVPGVSFG
jgi:hypothetical protein